MEHTNRLAPLRRSIEEHHERLIPLTPIDRHHAREMLRLAPCPALEVPELRGVFLPLHTHVSAHIYISRGVFLEMGENVPQRHKRK